MAWPGPGIPEELLASFEAATAASIDGLTAEHFGRIPLLAAD